MNPAPYLIHQKISGRFTWVLGPFIEENDLGVLFAAPTDVILSRHDIAQPDLVFVSKERSHILTKANIQGVPDLVIEILSDSTRKIDEGIKYERYERFGVREYWLTDPFQETVTVWKKPTSSGSPS